MEIRESSGLELEQTFKDFQIEANLQEQSDEITALQSIFNTDRDEKFQVVTSGDADKNGQFSLHVTVCPLPLCNAVQVEIAMPGEQDNVEEAAGFKAVQPKHSSDIELSKNIKGSFLVKYLSPLYLSITFPTSYPSSNPPKFHLSCPWLTQALLESLHQALDKLWDEGNLMPIVYTWINWLENNALSHLGISDHLILRPTLSEKLGSHEVNTKVDEAVPWLEDIGDIIATMKRYNQEQLDIEFCQSIQECPLCYDKKPGLQFFRIQECPHIFCHDCMKEFCELHVRDGTVEALRCPVRGCNSLIPPYIVQAVLGPQAYERWEQLLLQKTLDAMSDTVYCPRCTSLVIAEADEKLHLAHCSVCYFAFCTQCERAWHQGRTCETDEEVLEKLELQQQGRGSLSHAEQSRFLQLKRKLEEVIESKKSMKEKRKLCPNCSIFIEIAGGCNMITCRCGHSFCWVCCTSVEGFRHFQNGICSLMPGLETAVVPTLPPDAKLQIQAQLEVNPDCGKKRCHCPMCKQVSLKGRDNNNHIRCWNCKSDFCFLCRQRIMGSVTSHYSGPCVQHS